MKVKWFTPAVTRHGGKCSQAKGIISQMVPHKRDVEPDFGCGQDLFRKDPPEVSKVASDIDGRLLTVRKAMQDATRFAYLKTKVETSLFTLFTPTWLNARGDNHA
jgi:hypothetical protein